jgi:hypothetical protein
VVPFGRVIDPRPLRKCRAFCGNGTAALTHSAVLVVSETETKSCILLDPRKKALLLVRNNKLGFKLMEVTRSC